MPNPLNQNPAEFSWFVDLLKREGVTSFLEVGSKYGESLVLAARVLPIGSRIVSIDLPWGNSVFELQARVIKLKQEGYDSHLIIGDSTNNKIIKQASALGPYDAIFIDANHTLPYVTKDWENYGPMGKIIAFHDINHYTQPKPPRMPIEAHKLWDKLKLEYRHEEIRLDPDHNGIGVLWR